MLLIGSPIPISSFARRRRGSSGTLKPEGGAEALRQAYKTALADAAYAARTAALEALAAYGAAEASSTLTLALEDKDWAVRVRADELLVETRRRAPRRHGRLRRRRAIRSRPTTIPA